MHDRGPPVALVPIKRWDRLSRTRIQYALRLTPDITALHVTTTGEPDGDEEAARLSQAWQQFVEAPARSAGIPVPHLLVMPSQFRSVAAPLLKGHPVCPRPSPRPPRGRRAA